MMMQDVVGVGLMEVLLLLGVALVLEGAYLHAGHLLRGVEVLMGVTTKNVPLFPKVFPLGIGLLILELRLHAILMLMSKAGIICLVYFVKLKTEVLLERTFSDFPCAKYEEF